MFPLKNFLKTELQRSDGRPPPSYTPSLGAGRTGAQAGAQRHSGRTPGRARGQPGRVPPADAAGAPGGTGCLPAVSRERLPDHRFPLTAAGKVPPPSRHTRQPGFSRDAPGRARPACAGSAEAAAPAPAPGVGPRGWEAGPESSGPAKERLAVPKPPAEEAPPPPPRGQTGPRCAECLVFSPGLSTPLPLTIAPGLLGRASSPPTAHPHHDPPPSSPAVLGGPRRETAGPGSLVRGPAWWQ